MLLLCFPAAFSGDAIIQQVTDGTNVGVGFDVLSPGPHPLSVTLQATGGEEIDQSWFFDPSGSGIFWWSSEMFPALEHHWFPEYDIYGEDIVTPVFEGYTTSGGYFVVQVSHVDIDLDNPDGQGDPYYGDPYMLDEEEATTGVGMPITYNGPTLPASFPSGETSGRSLFVNITTLSGGTLYFEGTGPQLGVYRLTGNGWEQVTAGIAVPAGGLFETFMVHTSNQFTGPVLLKARLDHGSTTLDAADEVKVFYDGTPPGSPDSYLDLAADSDNNNFGVAFRPPEYTQEEEDEEEVPGMQMSLGEGWARIELNADSFNSGQLTLMHDDAAGYFEFADANFNIISGTTLFDGPVDETTFSTLVFYVRPKPGVATDGNTVLLTASLTDSEGRLLRDTLRIIANIQIVDLDIFNGQGPSRAVQDQHEEAIGAFTVANQNDTDGDGTVDNAQNPVPGEKDLMKLVIWKPMPDNGGNVTLQFDTGSQAVGSMIKLWTDATKTSEIPLTNGTVFFPTNTLSTAAGSAKRCGSKSVSKASLCATSSSR